MASKFDQFLKASWNVIFFISRRTKRRCGALRRTAPQQDAVGGVLRGEDLGGGRHRVSVIEATKRWMGDPTRRPRLGGGLRKAAPWYSRASLLGPQAALGEVLGGVLGALGGVLGASWAVLEATKTSHR